MFLSPCLLAAALLQESPPAEQPEIPKAFANLDTMRRMLVRRVAEKSADIGPKSAEAKLPPNKDTDGDGFPDTYSNDDRNVAADFLRVTRGGQGESAIDSHGDYVPGLAAIISLTVPVRTDTVRAGKGAEPETAAPRNEDDADWEEIAKGNRRDTDALWRTYRDMLGRGDVQAVTQRYSAEALAALRKTVVDTMWRFGHKLELGRGERLAVVVTVQPASSSLHGTLLGNYTATESYNSALKALARAQNGGVNDTLLVQPPRSQRIVFQVSGDDLRAFKAGDLEQDELAKKTRVQSYVMPAEEATSWPAYGSSSAR